MNVNGRRECSHPPNHFYSPFFLCAPVFSDSKQQQRSEWLMSLNAVHHLIRLVVGEEEGGCARIRRLRILSKGNLNIHVLVIKLADFQFPIIHLPRHSFCSAPENTTHTPCHSSRLTSSFPPIIIRKNHSQLNYVLIAVAPTRYRTRYSDQQVRGNSSLIQKHF